VASLSEHVCEHVFVVSPQWADRTLAQGAQPHVRQQDLETPNKGSPGPHHFAGRDKQNVMDRNSDCLRKD